MCNLSFNVPRLVTWPQMVKDYCWINMNGGTAIAAAAPEMKRCPLCDTALNRTNEVTV